MEILPDLNASRILLVENDLKMADHVVEVLRGAGYYVQNAYNFGDAMAADHSRFDAALVNTTMRDRDGTSILEGIKRHRTFSQLPILAMTEDVGVPASTGVLHKPYNDNELLERVARFLIRLLTAPKESLSQPQRPQHGNDLPTEPSGIAFDARLQQQLAELKTLSTLARSISSVLELSEVLNQIVEAATTLTQAEEGMLLLPDEEGKALYLRAMKGVDDASARNFRIKAQDPLVGRVFTSGEPVLIADRGLQRVKTEYFVKSLLYVPMTYKGQMVGVLGVNNRTAERLFTNHDQELLLDLAANAAIAIENARLYEERLTQNRQLTMLVAAGDAVNSTLALGDVLSIICKQVIQTLDANICLISQQDPKTGVLYPLATTRRIARRPEQTQPGLLEDRPVLKRALEQNAFYNVQRRNPEASWRYERPYLDRDGTEEMVVLPIRPSGQAAIGVLELFYYGDAPEVTSEFRAKLRSVSLEIFAAIADRKKTLAFQSIFSNAQRILDLASAAWMNLSLIQNNQDLVKIVEYGSGVYLNTATARQVGFPQTTAVFQDQAVLNYYSRQSDLPELVRAALVAADAGAVLSLPLAIRESAFGAVTIYNTQESRSFTPTEISLASALVTQAATAIENAKLYNDLEHSLSDLREAQAQLVQAARLSTMGELAAVVAHQINNPLTTIMGDAELILQEIDEQHSWYEGLTAIRRAGQRAHAVVKRLLSTARRGNPGDALQPVEVHETIHNTLELVTMHIERSSVRFKIALDESEKAYVEASPGHLEDLWLNLLLNARDALINVANATITIQSQRTGDTLEVSVCDNGPGIPSDYLVKIFEAFFTTKPVGEGTGLGLYICKQIVDQCQGTIRVETAADQGTCFIIALPVKDSYVDW